PSSSINPFIGVGIGGIKQNDAYAGVTATTPGILVVGGTADDDWNVAYQGILGLEWRPSERLSFDLTYRYLTSPDVSNSLALILPPVALTTTAEDDWTDQSISVGIRYALSEPPPPPPPRRPRPRRRLRPPRRRSRWPTRRVS